MNQNNKSQKVTKKTMNTLEKTIGLSQYKWADDKYNADNAPIYSRDTISKLKEVALLKLNVGDTFFFQQWPLRYAGQVYLFRLVRKRATGKNVFFDCAWLNKKRKLLRDENGRALFSTISHFPLQTKMVYRKKKKKRKAAGALSTTPAKEPKLQSAFKPIKPIKPVVKEEPTPVKPEAQPVVKEEPTPPVVKEEPTPVVKEEPKAQQPVKEEPTLVK